MHPALRQPASSTRPQQPPLYEGRAELADEAYAERNYERFDAHSRAAWGYESRLSDVQKTAQDVVKGVLFHLWLILPFSFFMERLL